MKDAHDSLEVQVKSRRGRMTDRTLTVADVMTRRVITLSPHHSFSVRFFDFLNPFRRNRTSDVPSAIRDYKRDRIFK